MRLELMARLWAVAVVALFAVAARASGSGAKQPASAGLCPWSNLGRSFFGFEKSTH